MSCPDVPYSAGRRSFQLIDARFGALLDFARLPALSPLSGTLSVQVYRIASFCFVCCEVVVVRELLLDPANLA